MKNKKTILALSLVLALGATMVVGGSLAWFSDTDEATNTFTVGSVEIEQNEVFDETNAQLLPVVATPDHDDPDSMSADNNFIQKAVTVTNDGDNPAYVQTFVAVPAALDNGTDPNTGLLRQLTGDNTDWTLEDVIEDVAINFDHDDNDYTISITQHFNVYKYRYNNLLGVGDTTSEVLSGIYVAAAADIEVYRNPADEIVNAYFVWEGDKITDFNLKDSWSGDMKLHVLVATQAVQAQGFSSADEALDSAFNPQTNPHPWYTAP